MMALCVINAVAVSSSRLMRAIASRTTVPVAASSAPVGSSHNSTSGRFAIARGTEIVWVPSALRFVMIVLRHMPRVVFRRLPV